MAKKLLELGSKNSKSFEIRSKTATKAEIIIYSAIGQDYWGDSVSAKDFSDQLAKLDSTVNEIDVRINSPGGDVFDGVTIYNRLRQHKAKINVYIDGLAASIASVIALAGDNIYIGEGALYMIHLPWTWAVGNRTDLDNVVNRLLDVEEQIIGIYAKKSGLDRTEIKAMLEAETWMDADQAIEKGFVDEKAEESIPLAASIFDKKWINKKPKNFKSESAVVNKEINSLKEKINNRLARK